MPDRQAPEPPDDYVVEAAEPTTLGHPPMPDRQAPEPPPPDDFVLEADEPRARGHLPKHLRASESATTTRWKRLSRRTWIIAAAVVAVVVALAIALPLALIRSSAPAPDIYVSGPAPDIYVSGSVVLIDAGHLYVKADGEKCSAQGIHEMREGTPIFVFDESGHLVDMEELGEGTGGADRQGSMCVFQFSVLVPDGHASYEFAVQDERAETFSLDDVRNSRVSLHYGS